jgi:hypothetical protein
LEGDSGEEVALWLLTSLFLVTDVLLLKQLKLAKRRGKIIGRLPLLFWDEKKRSEQPQGDFFALQRERSNINIMHSLKFD